MSCWEALSWTRRVPGLKGTVTLRSLNVLCELRETRGLSLEVAVSAMQLITWGHCLVTLTEGGAASGVGTEGSRKAQQEAALAGTGTAVLP